MPAKYVWLLLLFAITESRSQTLFRTSYVNDNDTLVNDQLKGTWKSIGGGYILNASDRTIKLYSYTSKHCYEEQNEYLAQLINREALFAFNRGKDTLSIFLHDFGDKTSQLQTIKKFTRINRLPADCSVSREQQKDPVFLFDLFWRTLKENYAYSKERHVNWDEIYTAYKHRISPATTPDTLFNIMGEIVTATRDQHTKISSRDGKTLQYGVVPSALKLQEIFKRQDSIKDFNTFAGKFFENTYSNISNVLLKGKGQKAANNKIEYGELTPEVGYIHIHSFTGFASSRLPRKQHIDTLDYHLSQIMKSFHDKKAIVVDVSLNFGGYDAAGLTVSGYFTAQPRVAYQLQVFTKDGFRENNIQYIYPSGKYQFLKPVYVVTSDITRSAAESFVMQMKTLPQVTVAGTHTLGITSDMLGKTIGDYYLTLSYQKYISPSGEMPEAKGVAPHIPVEIFPEENMFNGHRDAIFKILSIIENKPRAK